MADAYSTNLLDSYDNPLEGRPKSPNDGGCVIDYGISHSALLGAADWMACVAVPVGARILAVGGGDGIEAADEIILLTGTKGAETETVLATNPGVGVLTLVDAPGAVKVTTGWNDSDFALIGVKSAAGETDAFAVTVLFDKG